MNTTATTVQPDQPVPDFSLPASDGSTFQLSAHRGQPLLLYFYPRDNTPGCTTEAQEFTALHPEFQALGVRLYGVSRDSLASHQRFIDKFAIPFPLLSDPDAHVHHLFDIMKPRKLYGRESIGPQRSTFLIDAQGRLSHAWRNIKAAGHAQAVLDHLRANL